MTDRSYKLSEREQRQWDAIFAAAFFHEFLSNRDCVGFDRAEELASAEFAGTVASIGVRKLLEWREDNNPTMGDELP